MIRHAVAATAALAAVALAWPHPGHEPTPRPQVQESLARQVPHSERQAKVAGAALGYVTAAPAARGHALVGMRIPRFGSGWNWTAVEGIDPTSLAEGPGHYSGTPLPGEEGNVAFAGHRAGHGDPFIDFDTLRIGDQVRFLQGDAEWIYVVTTDPRIISANASWVLDPLPGSRLTLTTCWPKYGSAKRMYVRGQLARILVGGLPLAQGRAHRTQRAS